MLKLNPLYKDNLLMMWNNDIPQVRATSRDALPTPCRHPADALPAPCWHIADAERSSRVCSC